MSKFYTIKLPKLPQGCPRGPSRCPLRPADAPFTQASFLVASHRSSRVAGCTQLSNASASKDQIAIRLPSESSNGSRRILSCSPSRITASNPLGQPHVPAGSDIVNPTAAGAAANSVTGRQTQIAIRPPIEVPNGTRRLPSALPSTITGANPVEQPHADTSSDIVNPTAVGAAAVELTRCQDQTGRHFCIRDAAGTKLRNSKARPAAMVSGNFQPDLGTLEKWPKSGPTHGATTTGITHETKPKCEIIQNGLVSGPSGTLKFGSSSQAVPEGTKAVLQPQAAEITEIALKMPIGQNAVTHMAEAKREVIIQDSDTVVRRSEQMGNNPGPHSEVNSVVKLPESSITHAPDHHLDVSRPPSQPDFTQSDRNEGHKTRSPQAPANPSKSPNDLAKGSLPSRPSNLTEPETELAKLPTACDAHAQHLHARASFIAGTNKPARHRAGAPERPFLFA
jgi:hypothetical protein